ncbi:Nif11-like leader peptide family natural product precursor [Microseira sp. BLCC-F43]|uniref:Nif11-like leader peptide family natural product precursor n=1 Tax=Microseira sp. BLCC-F43 TaxID=3153602 RepID=UPI0035BA7493
MSMEQVRVFYEVLASDKDLYEKYFNQCGSQGLFGSWHWNKTKIVSFGATLGYTFTENELEQAWFETTSSDAKSSIVALEYDRIPQKNYLRNKVKNWVRIGVS